MVGYARVQFPTYDNIVSDWLPIIKTRAMNDDENWPLELNEQVACMMSMSDDDRADTGVILGAISNDVDTPFTGAGAGKWNKSFSDGGLLEYDKNAKLFKMNSGSGETLFKLLKDFFTVLGELTVETPSGNSSTPINLTTPGPSGYSINDMITRISNLLQ